MTLLRFVEHLRDLTGNADIILSDVWGVLHDGKRAFPEACAALRSFRQTGGTVVLITNAPRPWDSVRDQLRQLGAPDDCYDGIVSSGDLTRSYIATRPGMGVFQIGPGRDHPIYHGQDVSFAPLDSADFIVCTGLFDDDTETPEDYRGMMERARTRGLPFVCANPDLVVERGADLIYCAGAIAELYGTLGGEVIYFGKPYAPIYDEAIAKAKRLRGNGKGERVLAIGDSVRTDLTGANTMGIDCVFVTRGIHAGDFEAFETFDDAAVKTLFGEHKPPLALMRDLRW